MMELETPAHETEIEPAESASVAVADAVERLGLPLTGRLYDAIDPDALDALIADSGPDTRLKIQFAIEAYRVVVRGDGRVIVYER